MVGRIVLLFYVLIYTPTAVLTFHYIYFTCSLFFENVPGWTNPSTRSAQAVRKSSERSEEIQEAATASHRTGCVFFQDTVQLL